MDTKVRSWVKSIVWRLIGIVLLGWISYLVTGSWKEKTAITTLFHTVRVVMYYYHERIWERISWGRKKHPLSDLCLKKELNQEDIRIISDKLKTLGYM